MAEAEGDYRWQPATEAIHHRVSWDEGSGAVMPPIYATSTFAAGNSGGFDYTRSGNPNFRLLSDRLASLEGAAHAEVFASGVSAITAIASTLQSGDRILAEENVYGCTYRLFAQVFSKFGVEIVYCDLANPDNWQAVEEVPWALLWLESPTNPLLKIIDLQALADRAQEVGVPVIVDNTFASPVIQRPLELGATLSLTSTTKYSNGHSDALGGCVATNDPAWHEKMVFAQKALGLQPSPFDCWLILRGLKTLPMRMATHSHNALQLAAWLEQRDDVVWVRYPWLESHPQYEIARRQMSAGSGIIVLAFEQDAAACRAMAERLQLFTLAESLGGIESLICHPATMTHASVPLEVREAVGITAGVVRLSVGCEAVEDLQADLSQALAG
jgi:cystathionine gamma-synthase